MSNKVIDASRVAWTVIKKSSVEEIKDEDRIVESPKSHFPESLCRIVYSLPAFLQTEAIRPSMLFWNLPKGFGIPWMLQLMLALMSNTDLNQRYDVFCY